MVHLMMILLRYLEGLEEFREHFVSILHLECPGKTVSY